MIVNLEQLADILCVSLPTLRALIKKGMPYLKEGSKGVPWEFESAECINWYIEYSLAKENHNVTI